MDEMNRRVAVRRVAFLAISGAWLLLQAGNASTMDLHASGAWLNIGVTTGIFLLGAAVAYRITTLGVSIGVLLACAFASLLCIPLLGGGF